MTTPILNLRVLAICQTVVGSVLALILGFTVSPQLGASFGLGAALMLFNVILLAWTWWRIITQKRIAWTLIIIVIKYAVVLGVIYILAHKDWFSPVGAGLGIASFVVAALLTAILLEKNEKEKN